LLASGGMYLAAASLLGIDEVRFFWILSRHTRQPAIVTQEAA
jgi:hypothetical protein